MTIAPTTLGPTTVGPTTIAPTSLFPTSIGPTTTPITLTPTTAVPPTPIVIVWDKWFDCHSNNYAGVLKVDTSISGVILSPSFTLGELELAVRTSINGDVKESGIYIEGEFELAVITSIDGEAVTTIPSGEDAIPAKANWIGWSKIGDASFALDRTNDAGFKAMTWTGYVYQILKLDKNAVVYGSKGITMAFPAADPAPTFGFKEVLGIGVKNKTAVAGDEFVHYCIDRLGCLWKLTTDGIKSLGYEEFLLPLTNPVLTWDKAESRLMISDGTTGFTYSEDALGGGYANLTGIYRIGNVLTAVSPDVVTNDPIVVATDIHDFGHRGIKSIESLQLSIYAESKILVAIDYRYKINEDFKTSRWSTPNNEGVVHLRVAGVDFRIRLKSLVHTLIELDYINIQYKAIDKRFMRGRSTYTGSELIGQSEEMTK